ncbi:MAG: NADH-quinone oxidoreductase subunit C [Thermoplasmatota archaeon]
MMAEDTFSHTKIKDEHREVYIPGKIGMEEAVNTAGKAAKMAQTAILSSRRSEIRIDGKWLRPVLTSLKSSGFDHFSALSCVDLIDEDRFELVYHLWSYGTRGLVMVKIQVDRNDPSIGTVYDIFRPAITYEREIHEMFGVDFPDNPRLTEFILEDWEGPPPMRKDFDSIEYVQDKYGMEVRNPKSLPPKRKKGGGDE